MIDVNVSIGHYPFRRFPIDSQDPWTVKRYLQDKGIQQACVSSLHAVFYADPQQGNEELLPRIADDDFFLPVGVVNPSLQNWEECLDLCVEKYGCRMVKIYPSYHTYRLTEQPVEALLKAARDRGVVVAIVQRLEDERIHHPLMKVPAPDLSDLQGTAQRHHKQPLLLLCAYRAEVQQLAGISDNLYFDISFVEIMNSLAHISRHVDPRQLLFGSHAPFFYPEAAIGKVATWQTSEQLRALVTEENLSRLIADPSEVGSTQEDGQ